MVRHFAEADKPIAASCHHAAKFHASADGIAGKTRTAYASLTNDIEAAGGEWVDRVTTDGNLVTTQAGPTTSSILLAVLDGLGTRVECESW